jgi:hypothetical protein
MTTSIVSIGENCCPAELLQGAGLRVETMLFDWARSNLHLVVDVIRNGLHWHIENNVRAEATAVYAEQHYEKLEYPHHPFPENRAWMIRCATRFFNAVRDADNLFLVHCSPRDIDRQLLRRLELELLRHRGGPFRIVALRGVAGKQRTIRYERVSARIFYYDIVADKPFVNNKMRGLFYTQLATRVLYTLGLRKQEHVPTRLHHLQTRRGTLLSDRFSMALALPHD